LLVWKIRQGLKKHISADRITAYLHWFWKNELEWHFHKEEEMLPKVIDKDHPMMRRMFEEHGIILKQLNQLNGNSSSVELDEFAKLINDHIRFEERELFGMIEQQLNAPDKAALEEALAAQQEKSVWEDQFWM
jgi:hemerythrin-like domain-containing protein